MAAISVNIGRRAIHEGATIVLYQLCRKMCCVFFGQGQYELCDTPFPNPKKKTAILLYSLLEPRKIAHQNLYWLNTQEI